MEKLTLKEKRIVNIDGMEKVDNFGMEPIRVNNK